jgi:hypothetical protein
MKKLGFLSFGHWTPDAHSQTQSAAGQTLISLTKDYPHEQPIREQLARMGIACKPG